MISTQPSFSSSSLDLSLSYASDAAPFAPCAICLPPLFSLVCAAAVISLFLILSKHKRIEKREANFLPSHFHYFVSSSLSVVSSHQLLYPFLRRGFLVFLWMDDERDGPRLDEEFLLWVTRAQKEKKTSRHPTINSYLTCQKDDKSDFHSSKKDHLCFFILHMLYMCSCGDSNGKLRKFCDEWRKNYFCSAPQAHKKKPAKTFSAAHLFSPFIIHISRILALFLFQCFSCVKTFHHLFFTFQAFCLKYNFLPVQVFSFTYQFATFPTVSGFNTI